MFMNSCVNTHTNKQTNKHRCTDRDTDTHILKHMRACIHTYHHNIHTYTHTYIPSLTYIHTYIHSHIHTCLHSHTHTHTHVHNTNTCRGRRSTSTDRNNHTETHTCKRTWNPTYRERGGPREGRHPGNDKHLSRFDLSCHSDIEGLVLHCATTRSSSSHLHNKQQRASRKSHTPPSAWRVLLLPHRHTHYGCSHILVRLDPAKTGDTEMTVVGH